MTTSITEKSPLLSEGDLQPARTLQTLPIHTQYKQHTGNCITKTTHVRRPWAPAEIFPEGGKTTDTLKS